MGKRKWKGEVSELSDGLRSVDKHTIYLARLPDSVTSKQQIVEAVQEFGQAVHVHIKEDLSHGFVHFAEERSAEAAVRAGGVQICHRHVEIREAKVEEKEDPPDDKGDGVLLEGESSFYWQGRLETFRRGHGFLRPLPGGEELPDAGAAGGAAGIHRGVYVSPSQMERFQLQDGDVVGAQVRPPRSQEQRFAGEFQGTKDEGSWALIHVCDVNNEDSSQVKRRGYSWSSWDEAAETLEWTGVVECWRNRPHGFLRPLAKEDRRSLNNPELEAAEQGVFISPGTIQNYGLRDGDVVKALICKDEGRSMILRKVLHVERNTDASLNGWCFVLEGLVETFGDHVRGFGFLRPAEDTRSHFEEKGCAEGVYIYPAQIQRFRLHDGQRVVGRIYPAQPPERSPKLVDIVPDNEADDIWQLLEKKGTEEDEDMPPERIRKLLGVRMHGRISRVSYGKFGYYGFLKADHIDIWEEVFFRVQNRTVEPREGEAVFFRLEIRRRGEGDWTPVAQNLYFHQGQELPPPEEPMAQEETMEPSGVWGSGQEAKAEEKGAAEVKEEPTESKDEESKDATVKPADLPQPSEAPAEQSTEAPSKVETSKSTEVPCKVETEPSSTSPVKDLQFSHEAASFKEVKEESSEAPKVRHLQKARSTYGKGDPTATLQLGSKGSNPKGSKGSKGSKGGKGGPSSPGPLPKGSVAQMLNIAPKLRIRPTIAPKSVTVVEKKKKKNKKNKNKGHNPATPPTTHRDYQQSSQDDYQSTPASSRDYDYPAYNQAPFHQPAGGSQPSGNHWAASSWANPNFIPLGSRRPTEPAEPPPPPVLPKIAPSQAPKKKVTKVLQANPKRLPRKRPVAVDDDYVMVTADGDGDAAHGAEPRGAAEEDDFVLVQVDDDDDLETKAGVDVKAEFDDDW